MRAHNQELPPLAHDLLRPHVVLLYLLLAGCAGCGPLPECVEGVHPGGAYKLVLIEPYTPESRFVYDPHVGPIIGTQSCGGQDGLGPGSTLEVTVTSESEWLRLCRVPLANLAAQPGWELSGSARRPLARSQALFMAQHEVRLQSGCRGVLSLGALVPAGQQPFAVPMAGQLPPVVVRREIGAFEASVCVPPPPAPPSAGLLYCADHWVARLESL